MPEPAKSCHDDHLIKANITTRLQIPFFASLVRAGFTSPAESYIEKVCDLNDLCIYNTDATYFAQVDGDSMSGDGIKPGDILVIDCSLEPREGKIALVWLNGEQTVKRLHFVSPMVVLMPSNPNYTPIFVQPTDEFRIFGIVTFVISKLY